MKNETILLVDDDHTFCHIMERALTRRGFTVNAFQSIDEALIAAQKYTYHKAIVDLKIARDNGLHLIEALKNINGDMEIIILTGYSSITTAVEAIKLGAANYLCKPIEVDAILKAFSQSFINEEASALPDAAPSLDRLEWEHIQKKLQENDGNISATARALGMHRRTLQRKLQKRPANI